MFTYYQFIQHLKKEKPHVVKAYNEKVEPLGVKALKLIEDDTEYAAQVQERWYTELVKPFRPCKILAKSFSNSEVVDWNLLTQLAAPSLSSEVELTFYDGEVDLVIKVSNDNLHVRKSLHQLSDFQIFILFSIFCEENISLMTLYCSSEEERNSLIAAKLKKLDHWNNQLEQLKIEMSNFSKTG